MENYFVLPSVFALALKLIILVYGRSALAESSPLFLAVIGSLFTANAIEFSGFAYFNQHIDVALFPLCGYYFAITTFAYAILGMSLKAIGFNSPWAIKIILALWVINSILIFIPGPVIAGVQSINYSITRIKGPYYSVAPAGFLLPNLLALGLLLYGVFFRRDKSRHLSVVYLLTLLPILVTELTVSVLMAKGVAINMTMCLSFASIASVAIMIANNPRLLGFTVLATLTRLQERDFVELSHLAFDSNIDLDDSVILFKYARVSKTIKDCGGDWKAAEQSLGKSESTLRRSIKDGEKVSARLNLLRHGAALNLKPHTTR